MKTQAQIEADLSTCRTVLIYAANALASTQGEAVNKRRWRQRFGSMAEALSKFADGTATNDDMRVFGLEKGNDPTDAT